MDSEDSWSGEALGLEECLFCCQVSKTLDGNIDHMTKTHGFFIPDLEYVCDLEGLITYLGKLNNLPHTTNSLSLSVLLRNYDHGSNNVSLLRQYFLL